MTANTPREGGPQLDGRQRAFIDGLLEVLRKVADASMGVVTYDIVMRLLKQEFVFVAHRKLLEDYKHVSQADIGLLTGISPEAIHELLVKERKSAISAFTIEERIILCWCKHPLYQNEHTGQPNRLLIYGGSGTFQGLVKRVSRAVTPGVALKGLGVYDVIRIVDKHWVELVKPGWKRKLADDQIQPMKDLQKPPPPPEP